MKVNSRFVFIVMLGLVLLLAAASNAEDFRTRPLSERIARTGEAEYVRGEILVKFKPDVTDHQMAEIHGQVGTQVISTHRGGVRKLRVPAGTAEEELVSRLQADPRVEYAELNTVCHAHMIPNDPYYSYQWHFPNINMPQAWDISTGSSVVVGILDSGIAYENYPVPSYEQNTVASGVTQYMVAPELDGTSFTAGYDFVNNDNHPNDNNAHGTHVSGTVAQVTNNGQGTAGMAFDCTLMPVKVLDYSGSGTAQSLADGLYWAADNGAQVVNMSLGWAPGYNPGSTVANAITYAYNHGVVLLASSGNAGTGTVSYPAAYSEVIAVGATRYDDARASYSQYGSALEIVAPGGDIGVDQNGDGYGDGVLQMTFTGHNPGPPEQLADPTDFGYWFYEGTSMACPHAVALVAMMIANGQTGVENIRTILHETAVDLGSPGWDQYYGYGRIDAHAALTYGGTPPVAEFTGSPTSGCAPLTVSFTDQSTGDVTSWDWDFGDGGTSTAQSPNHQYAGPGYYTVSLTVTGPNGSDTETKTDYIHVQAAPVAAFAGSPTSGCAPLTVSFTDRSAGDVTSWDWDFGDGGTSTLQNPSHQYTAAGDYTVTLTATGPCGSDSETKTDYIQVGATLVAGFSGAPTSGCAPLTVDFYDESTGDVTSWDWDFGDGGTSTLQNPSHQYSSPGDYTVALTVTGSCGSDSETKTDYVSVGGPPVAGFYGSPTSGEAPLTVDFYDQSTGDVTSWDWDFGDGGTSTLQNPTYQYALAGDYTVTLTVTGACGSDVETRTDYIHVTEPGAGFCDDFNDGDASDWTVVAGTWSVVGQQYDGFNSGDRGYTLAPAGDMADGTITVDWTSLTGGNWTNGQILFGWQDSGNYRCVDMRDGANKWFIREYIGGSRYNRAETVETINTNQQYHMEVTISAGGLVTVYVDGVEKVSYDFGSVITGPVGLGIERAHAQFDNFCTTSEPPPVPPVAGFSGSPTSGCVPLAVDFTDLSTGEITSWSWDFGDGGTSTAQNPSHTYNAVGTYTVELTVTGPGGSDTETRVDYITVTGPPVAGFAGAPLSGTEPLTVDFTDQSTGGATSWSWDFGDGGASTAQNPSHVYEAAGTYTVELTATNACGSDTETKVDYITVEPCVAPAAGFAGDPTGGDAPLTVDFTDQSTGGPTSWSWDFGDGGASTAQNPSHIYEAAGTYTVELTATNACGSDTETKVDYITVTVPPPPPVAAFSGSPTSGCATLAVDFTDASTGEITSWSWDFGDGGTSTAQNPSHSYTAGGLYTVELTVTGPGGSDTETKTDYITVTTAPVAGFVGAPTSGDVPLTVDFTDQSTGGPTSWSWDFGDGGTSTAQNPSHIYEAAGTYTVALTATNSCGSDIETRTDYITVTEPSADAMHVHDIAVTRNSFWWFSRGIATVTIYDQGGSPVPSATVYGSFSGPRSQSVSGSTNSSGQVTFTSNWSSGSAEWCFEVTDVVKTDWTYDSAANTVTKACESGYVNGLGEQILAQDQGEVKGSYALFQNYPDPFRGSTTIAFELAEASRVHLEVYSIAGRRVATLVDGVSYPGGVHTVTWRASGIASGVYFYRIKAGSFVQTRKMLLTR